MSTDDTPPHGIERPLLIEEAARLYGETAEMLEEWVDELLGETEPIRKFGYLTDEGIVSVDLTGETRQPDQLDVQIEMERRAINRDFDEVRKRVAQWEPGR